MMMTTTIMTNNYNNYLNQYFAEFAVGLTDNARGR